MTVFNLIGMRGDTFISFSITPTVVEICKTTGSTKEVRKNWILWPSLDGSGLIFMASTFDFNYMIIIIFLSSNSNVIWFVRLDNLVCPLLLLKKSDYIGILQELDWVFSWLQNLAGNLNSGPSYLITAVKNNLFRHTVVIR